MTIVMLGSIVFAMINFLKFVSGKDWNSAKTQLTVWVGGIVVVALAAQADVAAGLEIPGSSFTLGLLDFPSRILVGLAASSLFSFGNEVKKAIDNTDNAKTPQLFK